MNKVVSGLRSRRSSTIGIGGLAVGGWLLFSRKAHALTDKDTIVPADAAV